MTARHELRALTGMRGIAAWLVVLYHIRLSVAGLPHSVVAVLAKGYLAVDFFFLLSGFVVAYAYDDRWGGVTQWEFYKRRLVRLQPMVILGSIIGAALFVFQIDPFYPLAAGAFMLARCAGKDKYYSLVETLFAQASKWVVPNPIPALFAIAKQAGFTQQTFDECLSNQKLLDELEEVRKRGADKFKIQATPTFFVNGERLMGAQPFSEFEKVIEKHLKS